MATSRNNLKKTGRSLKSARRPKPDRRWTLLFIGNRGRTLTLKRFKGMVLFALLILTLAIAAAAGLFLWNRNIIMEKQKLASSLEIMRQELTASRHEKDILMTRLVLAESKVRENPVVRENSGDRPEKQLKEKATDQIENVPRETEQPAVPAVKAQTAPVQKPPEPKKNSDPPDSGLSVAVENFKITNSSSNNKLRIQFKIKNTSSDSRHVSGHAIVVLKGKQIKKSSWMAVPGMPLVEGKPTGRHRGYSFGINYFRTMRFSTAFPRFPEKYHIASVYVFAKGGELLLEQDFAVKLPATQKTTATPLSHAAPLNALKNTSQ